MNKTRFHSALIATACVLATTLLPAPARADDAVRIRNLESEIQQLRTKVAEQDRRIQRLEAQLEQRAGAAAPDYKTGRRAEPATTGKAPPSGPLPWHSPQAWERVAIGMSQEEIAAILGEPSVVEAVDDYKTLFYSDGRVDGSAINGHVNLKGGRVVAIKKPASL